MKTIHQLQHEHEQLRRSLALMDTPLQIGAPAWPILQEACVNCFVQLEQHIGREEPFRVRYMKCGGVGAARKKMTNHKEEAHQLGVILHHLLVSKDVSPRDTDAVLYIIIKALDQQMEEQEQQLFPAMEPGFGGETQHRSDWASINNGNRQSFDAPLPGDQTDL